MVLGYCLWLSNTWQKVRETMARNPELWSLFMALILSGIVSHLDNPKGNRTPFASALPPRIFSSDSPVAEFTTGDIMAVRDLIITTDAEVWMIMYYAHWDAHSLATAIEFEEAARQLSNQVLFMAVNCWYPAGGCRHKVAVPYYPILFAHHDSREGVQYTGLQKTQELVEFMKRVCSPVQYLPDMESLDLLRAQHDSVAVAYFSYEHTHTPQGLASYQWASMLHLEKDPIQPTPFAIVTSKHLAASLELAHNANLTLLRNFNTSLTYPASLPFKARPILDWVSEHRESLVQWIAPPSLKSTILSSHISHHPSLILFTPHFYGSGVFDSNFMLLREVALQYYNCLNNRYVSMLTDLIQEKRSISEGASQGEEFCQAEDCSGALWSESDCCQTLITPGRIESITMARGNVCEICETFDHPLTGASDPCLHLTLGSWAPFPLEVIGGVRGSRNACLHLNNFYSPYSHYRLCCQDVDLLTCDLCPPFQSLPPHSLPQSSVTSATRTFGSPCIERQKYSFKEKSDYFSDSLGKPVNDVDQQTVLREASAKIVHSSSRNNKPTHEHIQGMHERHIESFVDLVCATNRTLEFRAMRSEFFWSMADRLGLKSGVNQKRKDSVGVAIVDIQTETHHVLQLDERHLSSVLLKQFIMNYTEAILPRHIQSSFPPPGPTDTQQPDCGSGNPGKVCITEVTTNTYYDLVVDNHKDVLLLYHAPWCGACLRIQHVYLQLAALFQSHHDLTIARINADANDLPWHLMAAAYPTILFFPGNNKSNSILFPVEEAITLPNLVEFVLQHMR
ncbi:thioredoxin domain-containing protein 11-like [Diadema setosum]|uniref:thioredoxin domain-containing protein 11-like n=1 Tax=Diadema setosum TaxID=31175 RepID=UPI003B3A8908